ncbi:MAG: VCBS repeat-containing protein, partial [Cyanobacteria bacterium J06607_17]
MLSGNTAISSDPYGLDFDGNSQSDIVWRHQATGQNVVWLMEGELGHQYRDYTALTNVGAGWDIKGVADFNQDGDPDILWRHQATGQNVVWHMGGNNNTTIESWDRLTNVGAGWDIKGTADFNQDGDPDILWRHQATGQNVVWHMGGNNNTAIESWNRLTTVGGTWDIRGISDFNQDGRPGIFWRNNTTGENVIWHMQGANNTQIGSHNFVTTVGLGWEPILTGWSPSKLPEVAQTLTLSELSSSIQTGSTYDIRWADNLGGAVNI